MVNPLQEPIHTERNQAFLTALTEANSPHSRNPYQSIINFFKGRKYEYIYIDDNNEITTCSNKKRKLSFKEITELAKDALSSKNYSLKDKENILEYLQKITARFEGKKINVLAYIFRPTWAEKETTTRLQQLEETNLIISHHTEEIKKEKTNQTRVIQRTFKKFAFKKKLFAEITRETTAHKRQKNQETEKPLYEGSIKSPEELNHVYSQLKLWGNISELNYRKSDRDTQNLISQNEIINDILLSTLVEMRKNQKMIKETSFKVVYDADQNIQASALFKIDQLRTENEKEKKIPLYISYIANIT